MPTFCQVDVASPFEMHAVGDQERGQPQCQAVVAVRQRKGITPSILPDQVPDKP